MIDKVWKWFVEAIRETVALQVFLPVYSSCKVMEEIDSNDLSSEMKSVQSASRFKQM